MAEASTCRPRGAYSVCSLLSTLTAFWQVSGRDGADGAGKRPRRGAIGEDRGEVVGAWRRREIHKDKPTPVPVRVHPRPDACRGGLQRPPPA
jgi:hypothetical protein